MNTTKIILLLITLVIWSSAASGWVSGYGYRMPIEINNTGTNLSEYQYNFTVDTASLVSVGKMQVDGSDCCIADSSDVLQEFWNETVFNDSSTKIWVNATSIVNNTNTTHYIYYDKSGASSLIDGDETFEFFDDFTESSFWFENIEEASLWSGTSPSDWLGRPSTVNYTNDNVWIVTYVQGEIRGSVGTTVLHIRFSTDEGATWTNADTYTDGSAVGGFPIDGHDSYGVGEALLIPAPNGDLILHNSETNDFLFEAADMNGVWQFRSIDGGGNWTDEGQVFPVSTLNVVDHAIVDSDMYITTEYDPEGDYTPPTNAKLYKSVNNGTNWTFVSNITEMTDCPPCQSWTEAGIEYCGNNTFLAYIRADWTYSKTMQRLSTDLGATWGALEEITDEVGIIKGRGQLFKLPGESERIYITSRTYTGSNEDVSIWYTENNGTTWSSEFKINVNPASTTDYVSVFKQSNGTYYALYGYGTNEDSDIWRATYNSSNGPDYMKWELSGSPSIASGEVILTDDDQLTSSNTFGFETIVTAKSKADEQDSSFVGYYTDANNRFQLQNSDSGSNDDFDNIMIYPLKSGASSGWVLNDGWNDFRNTYYQYTIKRISTSLMEYSQGANSNTYTNSAYIPTGDMSVGVYVWDSSQESTLTSDWIFVRKYAATEPTTSLGSEESNDIYIPPDPTNLANTTGNFWVNYTWSPGSGNVTDSYNVSYNGTWDNTSSNTYRNESVGAHGYLDIEVYAYNNSGGTLSSGYLTDNVSIPNNAISISGVSASYTINEGDTLSIDANYSDTDSDTGTFDDNSSVWDVDENTGLVSWVTVDGDDGTYNWYINITDGYGSTSTQEFTVTVNNSIYPPTITLVSFSPSPLNTNYTGTTVISYIVNSSEPLNLSSLAFLHGVNYTITGDMHNYLSVPYNDISDGYYKAPYRNVTPYLSWEFNDTITNGNVWQWGGGDNDSSWITKTPINATHTWINVTRMVPESLSNAYFIDSEALYDAPKTGFEINRQQGIILKGWDLDQIRNRNNDYFISLFFDTSWESTLPTYPIEIGYCNESYNPAVDDIDTCPNCTKFLEWNGTRWINHSWIPSTNASYASPLVINAQYFTDPSPDDIAYVWLRSYAISSKSYVLNATNYDPGLTNITFAETQSMWTYNEQNGVTSPAAYTPSYFAMYTRDDEDFLHHLYIANDQGVWGHSDIFSEAIGVSTVPVSPVSFEHFNITHVHDEDYINDTFMDATYDAGSFDINIFCPADPDGGSVSHNLTLHYSDNQTFIAIINNTFTTTGNEYVDINFTTTPYYSSSNFYKLKCVSTDDEGSIATKWLISDFTLDADGNTGWIVDDKLLFWGMNDIPTLYTTISNNSLISYDGGSDVYTMHVPFFKSKFNDTFYFNETVYLESLNNENVSYFRFVGDTFFNYANIHAWNTTSSTLAPITDTYRGYVINYGHSCGYINNSNLSYLGSDLYRQEGLNFIENTHVFPINNTTLSHNAEGPIMEDCTNFIISNCTISDNANVGIGVYFSNDITIENNTITSNAGYSISVYEGFNNTISYNDISDGSPYGIRFWSGAGNNTCTGNDISGSTLYDYYYSGDSFENYLIDPASSTNKIRVTSTSSLNIENTDNAAFSEDSLNTSYAYLTNFSMYVTGVSQTFDITQHNAIITPSTDKLSIWNLEWDDTLTFNVSSDTAINPTWFNITNTSWTSSIVNVSINGTLVTTENTDVNGLLTYNYTDTYSEKWFEFQLYSSIPTPTPTPTVTTPPSGGSSSGTGTTGVGTSDEPLYNIECRETGRIRNLQSGTETYYRTTKPDCTDIIKVTFTPTQNSPEQPILIEKLHNKSRFVTEEAPLLPYSYFNLYVGLFGFDEKTTNEKILFKVSKNWTTVNNVTPESVTLYIFDPSTTSWKTLPTTISHTDTLYYVYESESGATYGRFAIVGTDKVSLNIIELITEKIEDIIPSIDISESKFITGATSLYNNLKDYIINLLPTSISFDTIYNIFDNENASTCTMAILTLILIAIISYFYNYEHGLIAGLLAIILMIIVTILQDTALIKIMSVEAGNIIISTVTYTTTAFITSYIIGEKLK